MARQWQYRTILFEFQKDGLLGDRYIDDEEVEKTLNDQGARGWELVNVTLIQEGLLAFCKRPVTMEADFETVRPGSEDDGIYSVSRLQEEEKRHIRELSERRFDPDPGSGPDQVGDIRISK